MEVPRKEFPQDRCTGWEKRVNKKEAMVDKLGDALLRDFKDLWCERVSNIKWSVVSNAVRKPRKMDTEQKGDY